MSERKEDAMESLRPSVFDGSSGRPVYMGRASNDETYTAH